MKVESSKKCLQIFLAASLMLGPNFAVFAEEKMQQSYVAYCVQPGDSLSNILHTKFKLQPLYGKHGYVNQVTSLNKGKVLERGDFIDPGDILIIPAITPEALKYGSFVPSALGVVQTSKPVSGTVHTAAPASRRRPSNDETSPSVPRVTDLRASSTPLPDRGDNSFTPFSKVEVSAGAHYLSLFGTEVSNQTTGNLLSELVPSFEVSWRQVWDQTTETRMYLGGEFIQFEPDQLGVPISHTTLFNSKIGLGLAKQFSTRLSGAMDVEFGQTLFYIGTQAGGIDVNQVPLLRLHPTIQMTVFERHSFKFSLLAGGSFYSASSYDNYAVQTGVGYDLSLQFSQEVRKGEFNCKIGYAERDQNTTYLILAEKDIGLNCTFSWGP